MCNSPLAVLASLRLGDFSSGHLPSNSVGFICLFLVQISGWCAPWCPGQGVLCEHRQAAWYALAKASTEKVDESSILLLTAAVTFDPCQVGVFLFCFWWPLNPLKKMVVGSNKYFFCWIPAESLTGKKHGIIRFISWYRKHQQLFLIFWSNHLWKLPSRELTYPFPKAFRWLSFSQGGMCEFPGGLEVRFLCEFCFLHPSPAFPTGRHLLCLDYWSYFGRATTSEVATRSQWGQRRKTKGCPPPNRDEG